MNTLEDIQIIDSREIIVELIAIKNKFLQLKLIIEACEDWYLYCDEKEFSGKADECIRLMSYFAKLCTLADPTKITIEEDKDFDDDDQKEKINIKMNLML